MTVRNVKAAIAGLVACGLVAFVPVSGWAQEGEGEGEGVHQSSSPENTTPVPENLIGVSGRYVTLTGCFSRGTIKNKEVFVLSNPTVGAATPVHDAACTVSGNEPMIKLERVNRHHMADRIALNQLVEVRGRLEKNGNDSDRRREFEVFSFSPVPIVQPHVAEVMPAPEPVPAPVAPETAVAPPAAPSVEAAPPAPEAPVGTTGVKEHKRHRLPHTASPLPLTGLIAFVTLGAGLALMTMRRRAYGRG